MSFPVTEHSTKREHAVILVEDNHTSFDKQQELFQDHRELYSACRAMGINLNA